MHRTLGGVLLLLLLIGCQGRSIVDDNPVLGPPPPRQQLSDTGERAEPLIRQVSNEESSDSPSIDAARLDEIIVATVSGQPVFAADVLRPYRPLIEAKRQMLSQLPTETRSIAAAQLDRETRDLLANTLNDHLDRAVVLHALQRELKQEQLDAVGEQIDAVFDERVNDLLEQLEITSHAELERILQTLDDPKFGNVMQAWRQMFGTNPAASLQESHDAFAKMAMAAEFLRLKSTEPADIDRAQLLNYYREHADEYDIPLEVKWQQVVVTNRSHDGRVGAARVMKQALEDLQGGAGFDEVARKYSDGPTAGDGGHRDWIEENSLADSEIEETLFDLQVGRASRVFDRDDRFEIVRVTDRRGGKRRSFPEVQDEIRKALLVEAQQQARRDTLQQMRDDADVVILFRADEERLDLE